MKLNRHNYEEYFILYLDNELSPEERQEVEAFAEQNPDLKAELGMLMQSKLTPDTEISFVDRDSLLRFDNSSISSTNYEGWLTAYVDDELTPAEKTAVEKFVAADPSIQKEFSLLQQTKLQPETIVFPYKESLYHKEDKPRVISVRWLRIAAAAVLLLAVSGAAIVYVSNNKKGTEVEPVANNGNSNSKSNSSNNVTSLPTKDNLASSNKTEPVSPTPVKIERQEVEVRQPQVVVVKHNNGEKKIEQKENTAQDNGKELLVVADPGTGNKPSNNLAIPIDNPYIKDPVTDPVTGSTDVATISPEVSKGNLNKPDVTTSKGNSYNKETGAVKQDDPAAEFAGKKTGGFRGFLRKVTRTIEKRANIKATDDDGNLLIAGLALKTN